MRFICDLLLFFISIHWPHLFHCLPVLSLFRRPWLQWSLSPVYHGKWWPEPPAKVANREVRFKSTRARIGRSRAGSQSRALYKCPWVCTKLLSELISLSGMLGNLLTRASTWGNASFLNMAAECRYGCIFYFLMNIFENPAMYWGRQMRSGEETLNTIIVACLNYLTDAFIKKVWPEWPGIVWPKIPVWHWRNYS